MTQEHIQEKIIPECEHFVYKLCGNSRLQLDVNELRYTMFTKNKRSESFLRLPSTKDALKKQIMKRL